MCECVKGFHPFLAIKFSPTLRPLKLVLFLPPPQHSRFNLGGVAFLRFQDARLRPYEFTIEPSEKTWRPESSSNQDGQLRPQQVANLSVLCQRTQQCNYSEEGGPGPSVPAPPSPLQREREKKLPSERLKQATRERESMSANKTFLISISKIYEVMPPPPPQHTISLTVTDTVFARYKKTLIKDP